jgi:DNA-binding CsgD family transcriptional regulator
VRRQTADNRDELTPQEAQIARLAADRHRTRRAARSCSSARGRSSGTCAKIFAKLGVTNRRQLGVALAGA